jgi:hypothetical protein
MKSPGFIPLPDPISEEQVSIARMSRAIETNA